MQSMYRTLESPKRLTIFLIVKILLIATSTWISLKSSDFDYNIYSIEKGFQSWNSTTYVHRWHYHPQSTKQFWRKKYTLFIFQFMTDGQMT